MSSPVFTPASYGVPVFAPSRNICPPTPSAPRAAGRAQPRPVVRGQMPEEPRPQRPATLTMPSPDQLGVDVRAAESPLDWLAIRGRARGIGVVGYHLDALPDGRRRFTCWVPGGRPGVTERIEATAETEVEAVRLGLERAALSKSR